MCLSLDFFDSSTLSKEQENLLLLRFPAVFSLLIFLGMTNLASLEMTNSSSRLEIFFLQPSRQSFKSCISKPCTLM